MEKKSGPISAFIHTTDEVLNKPLVKLRLGKQAPI